jgi:hypothetical protein
MNIPAAIALLKVNVAQLGNWSMLRKFMPAG